jgi:hypothetical protein
MIEVGHTVDNMGDMLWPERGEDEISGRVHRGRAHRQDRYEAAFRTPAAS